LAVRFPAGAPGVSPLVSSLITEPPIIGSSDALRYVLHRVDQVAPTDASVLLLGETGTGKELIARAIHCRSPRRDHPFVIVDCGSLPPPPPRTAAFGRAPGARS